MNYYLACFKKYADFKGRAQRAEYWYFVLFNSLISFAINFFGFFGIDSKIVLGLAILYVLATFIPSLAVLVRRLHDTGHSGWWFFIVLIPLIGVIILFVFLVSDSASGSNEYGANPKAPPVPQPPVPTPYQFTATPIANQINQISSAKEPTSSGGRNVKITLLVISLIVVALGARLVWAYFQVKDDMIKAFNVAPLVVTPIDTYSSIVSAEVSSARDKTSDIAVRSELDSIRAASTVLYSTYGNRYNTDKKTQVRGADCGGTQVLNTIFADTNIASSLSRIKKINGGLGLYCNLLADGSEYAIVAPLKSAGYACLDSTGALKTTQGAGMVAYTALSGTATAALTNDVDVTCN